MFWIIYFCNILYMLIINHIFIKYNICRKKKKNKLISNDFNDFKILYKFDFINLNKIIFYYIYKKNFFNFYYIYIFVYKKIFKIWLSSDKFNCNNLNGDILWRKKNLYIYYNSFKKNNEIFNLYIFKQLKFKNIILNLNLNFFFEKIKNNKYIIKFIVSDYFKNINVSSFNYLNILFLRKIKIFNKGRYSRNRQYYRTGVYWCLYINIIAVIGIYFWFYRFNMNFGYLWWLFYFFLLSLFFSKILKFNFFNLKLLMKQIINSIYWYLFFINNFFFYIKKKIIIFMNNLKYLF